jgi:hypothetical protein
MRALRQMFAGFMSSPPYAFVLCGNFIEKSYGQEQREILKGLYALI